MNYAKLFFVALLASLLIAWTGCEIGDKKQKSPDASKKEQEMQQPDTGALEMVDITTLDSTIALDIRYATTNNFVERVLYDCPRCLLRKEVANAVVQIHKDLQKEEMGVKLFDCYRPLSVQKELYSIVPDTSYVADPAKGSNHNRGIAVDLTIVDENGKQINMGTPFDHFGIQAHHDYTQLPDSVLQNRRKLKSAMIRGGFKPLSSEWWHYTFKNLDAPVREEMWDCPDQ